MFQTLLTPLHINHDTRVTVRSLNTASILFKILSLLNYNSYVHIQLEIKAVVAIQIDH